MGRHHEATARELEFEFLEGEVFGSGHAGSASVSICVVCGRARARKGLDHYHGRAPAKLCLRCHDAVMQQRKMLRAELNGRNTRMPIQRNSHRRHHLIGDAGLIVPRGAQLSREVKYAELTHHRHRAQVAVRRAVARDLLD